MSFSNYPDGMNPSSIPGNSDYDAFYMHFMENEEYVDLCCLECEYREIQNGYTVCLDTKREEEIQDAAWDCSKVQHYIESDYAGDNR
jgi:hypothetical protein